MNLRRTLGSKGQVVIPKDLRQYLGITVGSTVTFEIKDGEVILRPEKQPREAVEEYISVIRRKMKKPVNLEKIIEQEALERIDLSG